MQKAALRQLQCGTTGAATTISSGSGGRRWRCTPPLAQGGARRARCREYGAFRAVRACNGRDAQGRAVGRRAMSVATCAGGAAARPLLATHGCFFAVQACKGRDAAWVGGAAARIGVTTEVIESDA